MMKMVIHAIFMKQTHKNVLKNILILENRLLKLAVHVKKIINKISKIEI